MPVIVAGLPKSGLPTNNVTNLRLEKSGSTAFLYWKDPDDTIIDQNRLSTWKHTIIVKKVGSYPENEHDGTVLVTSSVRDQYSESALTDMSSTETTYYRAFPVSTNNVVNYNPSNRFDIYVYGFYIDELEPDPSLRVKYDPNCDNATYSAAYMDFDYDRFEYGSWKNAFFLPKPCMLKSDGTVDYYLNPNDYTKKLDGSDSDVTNTAYDGNAMMEWVPVYIKSWFDRGRCYTRISNVKLDNTYECYSAKNADGSYMTHYYMAIYPGSVISNKLRSLSTGAVPTGNTNATDEWTYATANGAGWTTRTWNDVNQVMKLFTLMFKNTNSQASLGFGAPTNTQGLSAVNGCANTKGQFYGTSAGNTAGMKLFGMENYTSLRWDRLRGLLLVNGQWLVKMTRSTIDGSTAEDYNITGDGYIPTGLYPPAASQSWITRMGSNNYGMVPTAIEGAATTYYSDGFWSNTGTGVFMPGWGGCCAYGSIDGVFCCASNNAPSYTVWNFGASLAYKPQ